MSNLKFLYIFFLIFLCNLTLWGESKNSNGICEKSCPCISWSPLTHCYLRCLKWSVKWTQPSSHRLGRLVQAERSDRHMVDLMPCCSFSVSSLQQTANFLMMRWAPLNSQSSSHVGDTSKQTQRPRGTILSMQTHSWPEQKRSACFVFQKHLQFKSLSHST